MTRPIRKPETKKREQPEEDTYIARLWSITFLGHQPGFMFEGKSVPSEYKMEYTYELLTTQMEDGRPFVVSEEVTEKDWEDPSSGKCSKAVARAKSLCGKDYREALTNPEKQLGQPCMVTVTHDNNGYARVKGQGAVGSVPSALMHTVQDMHNTPFIFDPNDPDMEKWDSFPEFKKNKITSALDFEDTELAKRLREESEY